MKKFFISVCALLMAGELIAQVSSNRVKTKQVESGKIAITGTTGSGYLDLLHQSANAAGPGSGSLNTRLFAKSGNVWMVTATGTIAQVTPTLSNPMTGAGDMIRGGTAGAPTNLPAGVDGQILVSKGAAAPQWLNYYSESGAAGLVNNLSTNSGGTPIKGILNGNTACTGCVGEELSQQVGANAGNGSLLEIMHLDLTPGSWLVSAAIFTDGAAGITGIISELKILGTFNTNKSDGRQDFVASVTAGGSTAFASRIVEVSALTADKTVAIWAQSNVANTPCYGTIHAARVR